ncbi:hypothetical protein QZH41_015386, partial [Actinostola sp. cb2023]
MGAIPKKRSEPVRWRLINDLSWPPGHSINDNIPKELYTCRYDTLDTAIRLLKTHDAGALMSREVPRAGSTCTSFTDPGRTTE